MYKEKVLVTSNDVDDHLNLKVSSIFKYMQMVSTNHSEILHVGTKETIDVGMAWVIIKMVVVINKYPKINDEIVVTTHPGETSRFIFPRFYEIYDKKGNLLISGNAIWVLVDLNTRHVIVKPFEGRKPIPGEKCKDDLPLAGKVDAADLVKLEDRKVRYSDTDLNGHLNNTKYIEYIIDTKDREFYQKYQVESILINYEKEVKEGETVSLYTKGEKDFIVRGEKEGATCFVASVEVKSR